MLTPIHAEITRTALEKALAPHALEIVIRSNKKQDAIKGQIGHSEYHFDNNQQSESQGYIQKQRQLVILAIKQEKLRPAWIAFGRLIHTAQDFYAHSNYVTLWLDQFNDGNWPAADEIDPLDELILSNHQLRTGKLYYPLELLSFIPVTKKFVLPLLPRDSHAWMNLDGPLTGTKFDYAFSAAVKRTQAELETMKDTLISDEFERLLKG